MAGLRSPLNRAARASVNLIVAAAVLLFFASLFASIAQAYTASLILDLAGRLGGVRGVTVTVNTPTGPAALGSEAAAGSLASYARSLGAAAVLTVYTGLALLTVALSARRGWVSGLHHYIAIWGILAALTAAPLAAAWPAYTGGLLGPTLAALGGVALAASAALPRGRGGLVLGAGLLGGLLVAAGFYMGAYPLSPSTTDFTWLTSVDLGVQFNVGSNALNALVTPPRAGSPTGSSWSIAAGLEALSLAHPAMIAASLATVAAGYRLTRLRGLVAPAGILAASAILAYASLATLTGPLPAASSYIDSLAGGSLEVRSYPTWGAASTSAGLASISMALALAGAALAIAGAILAVTAWALGGRKS